MKRISTLLIVIGMLILVASNATAQLPTKSLAAGFSLGEPTGLTFKGALDGPLSLDAAVAWSLTGNTMYLHVSGLYHYTSIALVRPNDLWLYAGGRFVTRIGNSFGASLQVPVGASYLFGEFPGELFLELAPGIAVIPEPEADFGGAIGFRWIFR